MSSDQNKFTREQVDRIRDEFRADKSDLSCPDCEVRLSVAPYAGGGTVGPVYEIKCPACERTAYAARGR